MNGHCTSIHSLCSAASEIRQAESPSIWRSAILGDVPDDTEILTCSGQVDRIGMAQEASNEEKEFGTDYTQDGSRFMVHHMSSFVYKFKIPAA